MKEIDYIFQNLDIKGFLDQIKKDSGAQSNLGSQVLDNVKNSKYLSSKKDFSLWVGKKWPFRL